MAKLSHDQESVEQLKQRFAKYHDWKEQYDGEGRLLYLSLNNLMLTQFPPELWQFTSLQELWLVANQLSSLPAELGQLVNLRVLVLSVNQLSSLAELGQLANLQSLSLQGNQLSSLPAELGQLDDLRWLDLRGNPLQPPGFLMDDTFAVQAHLRAILPTVERFEAKIILVGEAGVGKTSLLSSLRQQLFAQDLPATHGIEVGTLSVPHPTRSRREITLYAWDFGGQEIYQATHQFFLTQCSVYVLVWDTRRGAENCRVSFWLETIQGHVPDAKVLLVATHTDTDLTHTPIFRLASYQQRYPQIVGLCALSNKTGEGLEALKRKIAEVAAQTPFVGQQWPRSWVNAEQQLLACSDHHIDVDTFLAICLQQKIEDETERETFGRSLHDLGQLLYFHDDPILKTLIVLRPNWISKAISRVLVDQHVQQAGGILEHRDLARIWSKDDQGQPYPRTLYPIFVRMMERFELCYQLEPERVGQPVTQSLLPQLLPDQPPANLPPVPTVPGTGQALVEMRYTLSFVPAGLMSWLLVRTHRYSQHLHWREGAHLAYHGQQAHLELDLHRREIHFTAWGAFPYTFFTILKETLDTILERFQGLHPRREVPCTCPQQREHPHWHDFDLLESQLQNGSSEFVCQSGAHLSLPTLLYGIHAGAPTQVVVTVQQTQQLVAHTVPMSAEEQQRRFDMIQQSQEFLWHTLIRLTNFEMQKEQTPCPSLFLLEREAGHRFNPKDWMSRAYRLHLLCQYPAGPHLIKGEPGYPLREGKDWWKTMSPWLRRLVTILKTGVPLGKAVGEVFDQVDTERLATQIDLFNEILTDLPGFDAMGAMSGIGGNVHLSVEQRLEGAALRVLFHFLDTADPAHRWHGLDKVYTPDGTILWVCEQHKREFDSPRLTGI